MSIERPTFATTMVRAGYDTVQVDDAVDRVVAGTATIADIEAMELRTVSYRAGYEIEQVDDRLDAVVEVTSGSPRALLVLGALVVLAVLAYVALA